MAALNRQYGAWREARMAQRHASDPARVVGDVDGYLGKAPKLAAAEATERDKTRTLIAAARASDPEPSDTRRIEAIEEGLQTFTGEL